MAILTTARTAAFMPAESPPEVRTASLVRRLPDAGVAGSAGESPPVVLPPQANGGGVSAPER